MIMAEKGSLIVAYSLQKNIVQWKKTLKEAPGVNIGL